MRSRLAAFFQIISSPAVALLLAFVASLAVAESASARQTTQSAARSLTSGEAIYEAGCVGCHGPLGAGAPETSTMFDRPSTFPDFTDCAGTTPELDVDWKAIITQGGHGRALSPIMPAFSDELTSEQVDRVIKYVRSLCHDARYPRGELNLPRPLRTEKAFPESETAMTFGASAHRAPDLEAELGYERRFTARDQLEVAVPFSSLPDESGTRASGLGDVALGWKHVFFAGANTILGGQGEIVFPNGDSARGLGSGVTTFGAFASAARILPRASFVQAQIGTDQPTSTDKAARTLFWRVAAGRSFRQEAGVGRLWSPMVELVSDRDFAEGARASMDVIPQFQVTLSRRQHVRANVGLQIPATNTAGRSKQLVFYLLWDWFDGPLNEGWR
jgi:mono/diheme cytochrome c family protein